MEKNSNLILTMEFKSIKLVIKKGGDDMQITLRAARVNAGLTIQQASQMLGISHTTLTKWEKRSDLVNPLWQDKFGKTYGIDPDYIFFGTSVEFNSTKNKAHPVS
ncbi:helix-turn-helix domain-containing protein [Peptostreptococcus anaerobius]|uniref:helix-turn-helix domain-containing protein n=1 Tax=Peptostreptococcus anaerobius TaxID=1261 RepID=UPI00242DF4CB|nr:helix-turn-helix transcriptional regulator [Peptostreptococcus anaerobius]